MRNRVLLFAVLFAAAVSCGREEPTLLPEESSTIHYRVTVSSGEDTRATVNGDMHYVFEDGDRLYMSGTGDAAGKIYGYLDLISGANSTTAIFEGDLAGVEGYTATSSTPLSAVLVSSSDALHTASGGVVSAPNYDNAVASSFEEAIKEYSHFTSTLHFGDRSLILSQHSSFLCCSIKYNKATTPAGTDLTIQILSSRDEVLRTASVTASATSFLSEAAFYAVFPENTNLTGAYLTSQQGSSAPTVLPAIKAGESIQLAANTYYNVNRSMLSFWEGFKIKATVNGTTITFNYNYTNDGICYSTDEGATWIEYTSPIPLNADDEICVVGNRTNYKNVNPNDTNGAPGNKPIFTANNLCYISGNIMSLLSDENLTEDAFNGAFSLGKNNNLTCIDIDPDNPLILPAMTLTPRCYKGMFRKCTSLTRGPVLPATTSAEYCYQSMFEECTGLTTAPPAIPVTTVEDYALNKMFFGCTSLESAPAFSNSLSVVKDSGCSEMFSGCTAMTTPPPSLPAGTLEYKAYYKMFYSCSSLTSIPDFPHESGVNYVLAAGTSAENNQQDGLCYQMFYKCDALTTLNGRQLFNSSTPLSLGCFNDMFSTCANLETVPDNFLPATTLAASCYRGMFQSCKKLTRAPDLLAATLVSNCYRFMFNSCSNLVYIKCYSSSPGSDTYTQNWLTNAKNAAVCEFHYRSGVNWPTGNNGIPSNWTKIGDTVP